MADKKVIREVNELKICCTNHREGCGWVGELGGLKSHLGSENGCGYVWVTCTDKGCRKRVSRKDLQTHLYEKCYYRNTNTPESTAQSLSRMKSILQVSLDKIGDTLTF